MPLPAHVLYRDALAAARYQPMLHPPGCLRVRRRSEAALWCVAIGGPVMWARAFMVAVS
jgi:hypothetical protein